MTKGALYHHFPNKHALGYAVLDEEVKKSVLEFWLQPLDAGTDPMDCAAFVAAALAGSRSLAKNAQSHEVLTASGQNLIRYLDTLRPQIKGGNKMERVIVTYKVKPDRVAENEDYVKAVYEELHQINDPDIHYATFKLDDGQTFVHIASFASADKQPVLTGAKAFKAFQENLAERCEVPPNPQKLYEVGSFNFV